MDVKCDFVSALTNISYQRALAKTSQVFSVQEYWKNSLWKSSISEYDMYMKMDTDI